MKYYLGCGPATSDTDSMRSACQRLPVRVLVCFYPPKGAQTTMNRLANAAPMTRVGQRAATRVVVEAGFIGQAQRRVPLGRRTWTRPGR